MDFKHPRLSRRRVIQGAAATLAPGLLHPARAAGLAAPIKPENAVIGFAHVGPISDEGWAFSHYQGLLAVKQAYPQCRYIEIENIPYAADARRSFRQYVAQGANIVMVTSEYGDLLHGVEIRDGTPLAAAAVLRPVHVGVADAVGPPGHQVAEADDDRAVDGGRAAGETCRKVDDGDALGRLRGFVEYHGDLLLRGLEPRQQVGRRATSASTMAGNGTGGAAAATPPWWPP